MWWPPHSWGRPVKVQTNWFSGSSPSRAFQAPPQGFQEITEMWGQVTAGSIRAAPNCQVLEGLVNLCPLRAGRRLLPSAPDSLLWVNCFPQSVCSRLLPLLCPLPVLGPIISSPVPIWTLQWAPGGWCFCRSYLDRCRMERACV